MQPRKTTRELAIDLDFAGVERGELERRAAALRSARDDLEARPEGEFIRVAYRTDLLREIQAFARERPARFTDVVQLGIGGSSLGARAVCAALLSPYHNDDARRPELRCHFSDNVDPESFGALLDRLNPATTLVHVVSKSGGTLETAAQLHAVLEYFRKDDRFTPARNVVATTGSKSVLRDWAEEHDATILTFPDDVAGRYSVFTASGLLVPALCGVPVARLLAGARRVDEECRHDAMVGAAGRLAALYAHHERACARPIHVEFIYADALNLCGDWFAQIWAESLGKQGHGPTPVTARGTTDQHSQIQLYVDGPDDKLYTLVRVDKLRRNVRIGRKALPDVLAGRTLADVFDAEAEGTKEALIAKGRPVVELRLRRIAPESIGALLMLQQLQTALAGALHRIDPFTQPGVEAGKQAALRILSGGSRSG